MCGINGIISKSKLSKNLIERMNKTIFHRGPDENGVYQSPHVCLGMQRLSIIDLESGKQPIFSEDKRFVIIFNGEIYNYKVLRDQLINSGHNFKTASDTEVILHLYEEEGVDCLNKLNGMFAIAIYDTQKKELFLARDRLGKKPLYYCIDSDKFIFSSELKGLLSISEHKRPISKEALDLYFAFTFIPAPFTIFKGIQKLEAGCFLKINFNLNYEIKKYWHLNSVINNAEPIGDISRHKEKIREILLDAVQIRMIADVPLGAFLSGGIDSSIIVGLMSQISGQKVRTFCIGNKEKAYDESEKARIVAKHFNTDHNEFFIKNDDYLSIIDKVLLNFDEPFGDSSALPTYFVSEFARKQVKVVLTGDGGDEVFAGYNRYLILNYLKKYHRIPPFFRISVIGPLINSLPVSSRFNPIVSKIKKVVNNEGVTEFDSYHGMQRLGYSQEHIRKLFNQAEGIGFANNYSRNKFNEILNASFLNKMLYTDICLGLEGDMLVKVDRTTMLNSLEARSPFLDYRLVEYSFGIPEYLKIRRNNLKFILKETFKEFLPQAVLDQKKQGFEIPVGSFLKNELKHKFEAGLNSEALRTLQVINLKYADQLYRMHLNGIDHTFKLWSFFVFANWVQQFQNYISFE